MHTINIKYTRVLLIRYVSSTKYIQAKRHAIQLQLPVLLGLLGLPGLLGLLGLLGTRATIPSHHGEAIPTSSLLQTVKLFLLLVPLLVVGSCHSAPSAKKYIYAISML
jgi:hypothetical protein